MMYELCHSFLSGKARKKKEENFKELESADNLEIIVRTAYVLNS